LSIAEREQARGAASIFNLPHAAGYTEAGCQGRKYGQYRLNDEFPSFSFHTL
jgi:hypothetical protein